MSLFNERRDQFEKKYFHDAELLFKARARRNKFLGLKVAEKVGKHDEAAKAYAHEFVKAAALCPNCDEGIEKLVLADLEAAGQTIPLEELRKIMTQLLEQAVKEIKE